MTEGGRRKQPEKKTATSVFEVQRRIPPESSWFRRLPPGDFRRFLRPPNAAGSAAPVSGRCGGREIERSGIGKRGGILQTTRGEDSIKKRKEGG